MSYRTQLAAASILIAVVVDACGSGSVSSAAPTARPASVGPTAPQATALPMAQSLAPTSPAPASPSPATLSLSPRDHGRTLAAGTYRVDGFAVPVALTLPAGWVTNGFKEHDLVLVKDNAFLALVVMESVYPDPCHTEKPPIGVAPGVDRLVHAFSAMKGFTIERVASATVGGAPGKSFTLANDIDLQASRCDDPNIVWIGRDADGAPVLETPGGSDALWVVDVAGTTVLIGGPAPVVDAIAFGGTSG